MDQKKLGSYKLIVLDCIRPCKNMRKGDSLPQNWSSRILKTDDNQLKIIKSPCFSRWLSKSSARSYLKWKKKKGVKKNMNNSMPVTNLETKWVEVHLCEISQVKFKHSLHPL